FDGGTANGNFVGTDLPADTNGSPTVASVSFAGAFTFGNLNDYGADGAGASTISYALQFHAGFTEGNISGLSSGGLAIRLYESGGVITGSTALTEGTISAGNTVFTLSVDNAGVVTLTQTHAVDHAQADVYNNAYISDLQSLANNLVDLKASVVTTDSEGDSSQTATALLDLGGNVQFGDDGPGNPTVTTSGVEPVALTFDGGTANGNFVGTDLPGDTNLSSTVASVSFAGAFTFGNLNDYGADGAGASTISYALQFHAGFTEGNTSGLTSGGAAIRLYESGGVITGSTALTEGTISAANTVFTLSVSNTGVVTLTQTHSVDHAQPNVYNNAYISDLRALADSLIDLKASVVTTDREGDSSATATALLDLGGNVKFGDDGPGNPTVTTSGVEPVALTYDGGLANGNFVGAEGAGDTNASSTVATVSFASAFTFGNLNDYGADGAGASTISYALQFHTGFTEGSASGLTSGGTAIRLYESGGVITGSTALTEGTISAANTVFTLSVSNTGSVTLTQTHAVDHTLHSAYNNAYITDLQQLASGLVDLKASAVTTDSDGDSSTTATALLDLGGNVKFGDDGPHFTLVNDGNGDGIVSLSALNPAATTTYTGQFADWQYGADGFGDLTATGANVQVASHTSSQIVLNLLDAGNVVATMTLNADGTDSLEVHNRPGTIEFTTVATAAAQPGGPVGSVLVDLLAATDFNVLITADDGSAPAGTAGDAVNTSSNGWGVKGHSGQTVDASESLLFGFVNDNNNTTPHGIDDFKFTPQGFTGGMGSAGITVRVFLDAAMATYDDVHLNVTDGQVVQITQLNWSAPAGTGNYVVGDHIYGVDVIADSGNKGGFRIDGVSVGAASNNPPPDLDFNNIQVTATDGDGDTTTQTFNVHIDGTSGNALTVEAVAGTSGADNLLGTAGNDTLIGGPGNDTLTGNGGNDLLVLQPNGGGMDTITDLNTAGLDKIIVDVSDQNLTFANAALINAATQFNSGNGAPTSGGAAWSESASGDKFYYDTTNQNIWFSANGTGSDQIQLAHLSTGLPPATVAAALHTA
ncbi:hypothetical protein JQ633_34220, partial [Bradyrhizobium tropiciagri]|uniref:beta strand repeat-containing protein n=1 Tax=Bradyrhizobium tropiciagri TaxID=312253 RepID=UPI002012EF6B